MTIAAALNFIDRALVDEGLRARINGADDSEQLEQVMAVESLVFGAHDFDEAYHHRLTQCQQAEAADQLRELKMWWDLLARMLAPVQAAPDCSGACSACSK